MQKETNANLKLQKLLNIQQRVFKQKSNAHWIEEGDGNNSYLFKCIKATANLNTFSVLKVENGKIMHKTNDPESEVLHFYKGMLRYAAPCFIQLISSA